MISVFSGHEALQDALNLRHLFTDSVLKQLLPSIAITSYQEQRLEAKRAWHARAVRRAYAITPSQAKRLSECELSTMRIESLYKAAPTSYDFVASLRQKGVNSYDLRQKLLECLSQKYGESDT